jgi:hypothetical protein
MLSIQMPHKLQSMFDCALSGMLYGSLQSHTTAELQVSIPRTSNEDETKKFHRHHV